MKPPSPTPIQTSRPELKNKPLLPIPSSKEQTTAQKVEGPVTRSDMKPLPPTPIQTSRPELKNKPLPLTPPQQEQLKLAQQILKKDGMELQSSQKGIKHTSSSINIGAHRSKKEDHNR